MKTIMAIALAAFVSTAAASDNFFSNFWGDSNNSARGEGNADGKAGAQGKFSMNFEGKAMTEGNMDGKAGGVGNNSASANGRSTETK